MNKSADARASKARGEESGAARSKALATARVALDSILKATSEAQVYEGLCRVIVEQAGLPLAWVGLVEPGTHAISVQVALGAEAGLLDVIGAAMTGLPAVGGTVGEALRTGEPQTGLDAGGEPGVSPALAAARARGIASYAAFPIRAGHMVVGVLQCLSRDPRYFGPAEIAQIEQLTAAASARLVALESGQRRRHAEQRLTTSELRYRGLFEMAPLAIMVVGRGQLEVNRALLQMFGYPDQSSLEAAGAMSIIDPSDVRAIEEMRASLETGKATSTMLQARGRRSDGSTFPMLVEGVQLELEGVRSGLVFMTDMTTLEAAETASRQSRTHLTALVDGSPLAIVSVDLEGIIRSWNVAAEQILGWGAGEVIGRKSAALPAVTQLHELGLGQAAHLRGQELTHHRRDGSAVDLRISTAPLFDRDGQPSGSMLVMEDVTERNRADEAVRRAAAEFRAIFDSVGDGLWIVDVDGTMLEANDVICERLGYSRDEMLQMAVGQLTAPDPGTRVKERMNHVLAHGSLAFETAHMRRDGTEIPSEVVARRIEFRGRPAILSVIRDITERRRALSDQRKAEEEIRRSRTLLRSIVNSTSDAVYVKDLEGRYLLLNAAAEAFVGKPAAEVLGRDDTILFPTEEAEMVMRNDRAAMAASSPMMVEERVTTASGERATFLTTKGPLRGDDDDTVVGLYGIARDVTARDDIEQSLRQSEARFRTLYENAGDAIMISDMQGHFLGANKAACERLGYTLEELTGMTVADISTPGFAAGFAERVARLIEQGAMTYEAEHVTRDGRVVTSDLTATVIELDGQPALLSMAHDLTERKQAEAERAALEGQLRQAQKMEGIGRLAGGIAHDFNNLLTAIRGNASLALAGLPESSDAREDLEQIRQAADRAAALTRQLLTFARRTTLQPEVVDLCAVVRGLEPMLQRLIGEDVNLVIDTPECTAAVLADPSQIEQVIVNLAVNAVDAMPSGGKLTIAIADAAEASQPGPSDPNDPPASKPMTAMTVADTGIGMTDETLSHLFEPFFTTKAPGKGTGLGLATVYGIVRQSGGSVAASSEPGHGSIFTVLLPRVEGLAPDRPSSPRPETAGVVRTGTVLIVEDDSGVRGFASRILQSAGYQVLSASDGVTAVKASDGVELSLLLTDIVMPGISGREVADRLAGRQPGLRVLYMSGHTDKGIVHDGIIEQGIEFLAKPFSAEALLEAVDAALARPPAG
jgi:PAS domain S-box-containing protein